jgi:hypothetical protein
MKVSFGTTRRVVAVLVLAVAAAGLAGCVHSPTAYIDCAWSFKMSKDTQNIGYPDTNATYWGIRNYVLLPGQQIILSGTYPYARYMSLHTYSFVGGAFDHIPDYRIVPDAGSDNPFTNPTGSADPAHRHWTVTVSPDAPATGGQNGDNLLATPIIGTLALRVYMPDPGFDETGGVPLPAVSVRNADGTITAVPTCPSPGPDQTLLNLANLFPTPPKLPSDPPVFSRVSRTETANIYPNLDNAYVRDFVAYQPGKIIVVRGKAPTTPDTQAGQSPATPSQLRYWSFCTNAYRKPYPVCSCVADHEAPLDSSGFYTIVVSTPAERPTNATPANGITWVNWGSTSVNMLMMMRHMIPAADFTQSAANVAPGQPASTAMGDYTPVAKFCDASTFEAGGATACGF